MWGNQGGYDGASYDNGGGYISSQGDAQNAGHSQERKKSRAQSLIPCTVAQLLKADQVDDKFMSDGIEINQISILGLVKSVKVSSTNQQYEIDDMTGPVIEVRFYADNDENTPEFERVPSYPENTYVYLCGQIRSFGGKRNVTAFKIKKVTDMNEIASHMAEVAYAHAYLKQTFSAKGAQAQTLPFNAGNQNAGSVYKSGGGMEIDLGLTAAQSQVLSVIRSCADDSGFTANTVADRLRQLKRKEIDDAMEFLSTEGHIYSTIDDDHYKATDN